MSNNNYFTLTTTALGTKRFRSKWSDEISARGRSSTRTIGVSVDGTVNVTMPAKHQRVHNLVVVFDGDESDPLGTYDEFIDYYEEGISTFVDWDGSTTYDIVIVNNMLLPVHLSPVVYPLELQVQFTEMTST